MTETSIYDTAGWMKRALSAEQQITFLEALYGATNLWKGECGHAWPVEDRKPRPSPPCPICGAENERDRAIYALDEARRAHRISLQQARSALWEYGIHKSNCAVIGRSAICDCGYFKALGHFGANGWERPDDA